MQPRRTGRAGWLSPAGIALVLAASALLMALGWWTYEAVEGSLREVAIGERGGLGGPARRAPRSLPQSPRRGSDRRLALDALMDEARAPKA